MATLTAETLDQTLRSLLVERFLGNNMYFVAVLEKNGITTVRELLETNPDTLVSFKGVTRLSVGIMNSALEPLGLKIGSPIPEIAMPEAAARFARASDIPLETVLPADSVLTLRFREALVRKFGVTNAAQLAEITPGQLSSLRVIDGVETRPDVFEGLVRKLNHYGLRVGMNAAELNDWRAEDIKLADTPARDIPSFETPTVRLSVAQLSHATVSDLLANEHGLVPRHLGRMNSNLLSIFQERSLEQIVTASEEQLTQWGVGNAQNREYLERHLAYNNLKLGMSPAEVRTWQPVSADDYLRNMDHDWLHTRRVVGTPAYSLEQTIERLSIALPEVPMQQWEVLLHAEEGNVRLNANGFRQLMEKDVVNRAVARDVLQQATDHGLIARADWQKIAGLGFASRDNGGNHIEILDNGPNYGAHYTSDPRDVPFRMASNKDTYPVHGRARSLSPEAMSAKTPIGAVPIWHADRANAVTGWGRNPAAAEKDTPVFDGENNSSSKGNEVKRNPRGLPSFEPLNPHMQEPWRAQPLQQNNSGALRMDTGENLRPPLHRLSIEEIERVIADMPSQRRQAPIIPAASRSGSPPQEIKTPTVVEPAPHQPASFRDPSAALAQDAAQRAERAMSGLSEVQRASVRAAAEVGEVSGLAKVGRSLGNKLPMIGVGLAGAYVGYVLLKAEHAHREGELSQEQLSAVIAASAVYTGTQLGSIFTGVAGEEAVEASLKVAGVPEEYRFGTIRTALLSAVNGDVETAYRMQQLPDAEIAQLREAMSLLPDIGTLEVGGPSHAFNRLVLDMRQARQENRWGRAREYSASSGIIAESSLPGSYDAADAVDAALRRYMASGGTLAEMNVLSQNAAFEVSEEVLSVLRTNEIAISFDGSAGAAADGALNHAELRNLFAHYNLSARDIDVNSDRVAEAAEILAAIPRHTASNDPQR